MSTNASFTSLKKVKPFKTKWRSQVILLHFWQQTTSFGETRQMVLADEYFTNLVLLMLFSKIGQDFGLAMVIATEPFSLFLGSHEQQ
ncbi:unnamed protein product [Brassica oleracea var. botrytis]|uniref:(rape) hypothetical protein n=1 Tax=Brassica napus TaxID=3708 RepID=A0A816QDX5_BRANA|nr:unnamed protein product [Brassica napus]